MSEPFSVGCTELRRRPGTRRTLSLAGPLPNLITSAARVDEGTEVHLDGELEAIEGGQVTLSGRVQAPWHGPCRRCLEEVRGLLDVVVSEVFDPGAGPDGDAYPLEGDRLDLAPAVRDAVLLALPIAPLCAGDCAGPAPEAYPAGPGRTDGPDDGPSETPRDPRWAALDALVLPVDRSEPGRGPATGSDGGAPGHRTDVRRHRTG